MTERGVPRGARNRGPGVALVPLVSWFGMEGHLVDGESVAELDVAKFVAQRGSGGLPVLRMAGHRSFDDRAHTSSAMPCSRRSGTGCVVIRTNCATNCSPLRRSNAA